MSNIKKAYVEIVELLEANEDKKVKSIIDQVRELASAKTSRASGDSALRDTDGNVVAIQDYYFKRFMPLVGNKAVEFGAKKNSSTGLNTMCKEGVSNWTKQQRVAKQANQDLLTRVANGEVAPENIGAEQAKIEEERKSIAPTELGFETKEEVVKYLEKNGVTLAA
jgi:hypothetical protein